MNLSQLGLGAGCVGHLCQLIMGWQRWHGVVGRSPGSPSQRVHGSRWRRGWLMARLRWRVWHRFLPRQLGTSCAEAASEDTGPAASLGLRFFSPLACASDTSPAPRGREHSSSCRVQTGGLILGEGLDGLKLVVEIYSELLQAFSVGIYFFFLRLNL